MKDSFGGTFMLYIMLIFFVIFVCLLAAAINLSKTFRVKNVAINYLEHYDEVTAKKYIEEIEVYGTSDNNRAKEHCREVENANGIEPYFTERNNVCIIKVEQSLGFYYKVFSYIVMDFPLFKTGILIPIGGETKTIIN